MSDTLPPKKNNQLDKFRHKCCCGADYFMLISPKIPILDAIEQLKFSRPRWTQEPLEKFFIELQLGVIENKNDGTFNFLFDNEKPVEDS